MVNIGNQDDIDILVSWFWALNNCDDICVLLSYDYTYYCNCLSVMPSRVNGPIAELTEWVHCLLGASSPNQSSTSTDDGVLTHRGRDKMAAIFQTTLSNAFSCIKMLEFRLKFHWSLILSVQLTIAHHWFRWWLGADQATSHYLNQWWLDYWRIYATLGFNELTHIPLFTERTDVLGQMIKSYYFYGL